MVSIALVAVCHLRGFLVFHQFVTPFNLFVSIVLLTHYCKTHNEFVLLTFCR